MFYFFLYKTHYHLEIVTVYKRKTRGETFAVERLVVNSQSNNRSDNIAIIMITAIIVTRSWMIKL